MKQLSHYGDDGSPRMVDISEKSASVRKAAAAGTVFANIETIDLLMKGQNPKGDPLEIARIAGIMAAKRTFELIPLCHQIALTNVDISISVGEGRIDITAEASATDRTGVEMEALTAVSVAALTIYDMCKAVQKDITIGEIRLISKSGGRSNFRSD